MKTQIWAGKWNYQKHDYEDYILPEGASLLETSMDKEVNCAECGAKMKYGESFSSIRIHTRFTGMGFAVCPECHRKEMEVELRGGEE